MNGAVMVAGASGFMGSALVEGWHADGRLDQLLDAHCEFVYPQLRSAVESIVAQRGRNY